MPAAPSRQFAFARWWPVVLTLLAGTILSLAAFISLSTNQLLIQPWVVLAIGMAMTILLTLYFSQLITRSLQVEAVVTERTARLSEMNEELQRQIVDRTRFVAEGQQQAALLSDSQRQLQEKAAALQHTIEELTRREHITQSLLDDLQVSRQRLEEHQRSLEVANQALKKSNEELKAAQLQVIQAAKLESVGRLAAGVAHEVKNPLAIVLMGTTFLQKQLGPAADAVVIGVIADMDKAVKRADGIIRGMLDFAAFKELRLTKESINSVVEQSLALAKHELTKAGVSIIRELGENLPPVSVDRTKFEQVFVNLFVNAAHAMAGGGQLTVRTRLQRLAQPGPGIGRRSDDRFQIGETVLVIEVDDTGKGIPPEILSKIFDPFFTTKAPGQGTGLGLSVTRSIIELHRGIIELKNRPEGGCRAAILLHAGGQTPVEN